MESYRNPKYIERLEDVIFELETPLNTTVANTRSQLLCSVVFLAQK